MKRTLDESASELDALHRHILFINLDVILR